MQCACAILSSADRPPLQYYFTLSLTRYDFLKKKTLPNIKCVFWFSLQLWRETFLLLRRNKRNVINVKYRLLLSDFNETDFRKIFKYQMSWKTVQWKQSCSFRTDGHDEAIVAEDHVPKATQHSADKKCFLIRLQMFLCNLHKNCDMSLEDRCTLKISASWYFRKIV